MSVKYIFVKESYDEGFRAGVTAYLDKLSEDAPESNLYDEDVLDTTSGFGNDADEIGNTTENLSDIFMKRDDLSHGPSSTTSGGGASNYS